MNKSKFWLITILFFIGLLVAHTISTIATVLIMTSNTTAVLNYWLMFGMAIILQLTTSIFLSTAIMNKSLNIFIRIILLGLAIYLFFASIIANVGLIQNDSNTKQNIAIRESIEYKQAVQANTNQQSKYDAKLSEKKSETDTYNTAIKSIENSLNGSKTDWERNKYTTMLNAKVTEKTATLKRIENELNTITISPIDTKSIEFASENGYSATFLFLSETRLIKWLFKNTNKDLLEYYFHVLQSTAFELINLLSVYLFCMFIKKNYTSVKKSSSPDPAPKQKIPTPSEDEPKLNLVKPKQSLSLDGYKASKLSKNSGITDADIKKYLAYVSKYCKNNNTDIVPGYQNTSRKLKSDDGEKMSETRVRNIVAWLNQEGMLKKENGRFALVKNDNSLVG